MSDISAPASIFDLFRLDGKVAVVTGASSGLGVTFAQTLAQAGADLVLGARRVDRLQDTKALVEAEDRRALTVATDVTDPAACKALIAAAMEEYGRVDILINNAGVGTAVPASKETVEEFSAVVDINLKGSYWMAQAAAAVMGPGSAIVNLSSTLAVTTAGLPQAAYTSTKAGVIGLTMDLAQQWTRRKGIRVNAVAPGFFGSEMTDQYPEGYLDGLYKTRVLIGRAGDAHELSALVLYLVSPAGGFMTGQTIVIDGGLSIN